jgi:hypothetical protein
LRVAEKLRQLIAQSLLIPSAPSELVGEELQHPVDVFVFERLFALGEHLLNAGAWVYLFGRCQRDKDAHAD